jgi:hypothetical protein
MQQQHSAGEHDGQHVNGRGLSSSSSSRNAWATRHARNAAVCGDATGELEHLRPECASYSVERRRGRRRIQHAAGMLPL